MKLNWRWRKLANNVYEADNGIRVNCGGQLIKIPGESYISGFELPHRIHLPKFRKIMGGNWRRALMAYVEHINPQIADN